MDAKAFLGRGWAYRVARNAPAAADDVALAAHEEDVRQAVLIILETGRGERVMRPDFGAGLEGLPVRAAQHNDLFADSSARGRVADHLGAAHPHRGAGRAREPRRAPDASTSCWSTAFARPTPSTTSCTRSTRARVTHERSARTGIARSAAAGSSGVHARARAARAGRGARAAAVLRAARKHSRREGRSPARPRSAGRARHAGAQTTSGTGGTRAAGIRDAAGCAARYHAAGG